MASLAKVSPRAATVAKRPGHRCRRDSLHPVMSRPLSEGRLRDIAHPGWADPPEAAMHVGVRLGLDDLRIGRVDEYERYRAGAARPRGRGGHRRPEPTGGDRAAVVDAPTARRQSSLEAGVAATC